MIGKFIKNRQPAKIIFSLSEQDFKMTFYPFLFFNTENLIKVNGRMLPFYQQKEPFSPIRPKSDRFQSIQPLFRSYFSTTVHFIVVIMTSFLVVSRYLKANWLKCTENVQKNVLYILRYYMKF